MAAQAGAVDAAGVQTGASGAQESAPASQGAQAQENTNEFDGSLLDAGAGEMPTIPRAGLYSLYPPQYATLGGKPVLFYEIYLANRSVSGLQKIEVVEVGGDGSRVTKTLEGAELNKTIKAPKAGINDYAFYMWVPLAQNDMPLSVSHKFYFAGGKTLQGAQVKVNYSTPITIAPPVYGDNWLAAEAPVNTNHHRQGLFGLEGALPGTPVVSQRYAIDWMQYGPNGKLYKTDASTNEDFWRYGQEIHAVADGVVMDARNDIPSNVPFQELPPVSLVTVAGNNVVQEIGDTGVYALYAHMIPGSVRVKIGDKVKKGDVLGLLGNTGNSDAPHLHFHLDRSKDALFGEGVPYQLESYQLEGSSDWKMILFNNDSWKEKLATPVQMRAGMPVDGDVVSLGAIPKTGTLTFVSAFEKGTKYKTEKGKFIVLDLHGSFRDMGRQYGYLMREEMQTAYSRTTNEAAAMGLDKKYVNDASNMLYDSLPERYVELMQGMSETSGLTLEQQKELNEGVISIIDAYLLKETNASAGCSGIAFWGNYSKDGKLYFGRNWDMIKSLLVPYLPYMTLAVYHPDSGNAVANLEWVGEVYTETAMNDKGIFLELNNGQHSDQMSYPGRPFGAVKLLDFMFDSSNMDDIYREFNVTLDRDSYIIQVADKDVAYSYEWPSFGVRRRAENVSGLLVAYNDFVPPYPAEWEGKIQPANPRDVRRENFLKLANSPEYKGKMDEKLMQQLLAVPFQNGGAMLPDNVYQVIAVPGDYKMWLHGQNYSGWEEIDLKPLFFPKAG